MEIKIDQIEFSGLYSVLTLKELSERYHVKVYQVVKIAKELGLSKKRGPKPAGNTLKLN